MLKRAWGLSLAVLTMTACGINENNSDSQETDNSSPDMQEDVQNEQREIDKNSNAQEKSTKDEDDQKDERSGSFSIVLSVEDLDDQQLISLAELSDQAGGSLNMDSLHRTAHMSIWGKDFYFVEEVPVIQVNGIHYEAEDLPFSTDEEDALIPVAFLEDFLGADVELMNDELTAWLDDEELERQPDPRDDFDHDSMTVNEMIDYLSFLESPIEDAEVSTVESHLPGAPRAYRNGHHEGIDWYDYTTDVVIDTSTPILAQGEGEVIRADHDFEDYPSHEVRDQDLELAAESGFTPEYILDRLRGQQVWIQYERGVMIRFAHLDQIPEDLKVGDPVDSETVIGYVGNSGTSGALEGDGSGLHLHQDLLVYDTLFYEPFSLEETKEIIHALWGRP